MSLPEIDTLIFLFINIHLQNNILDTLMIFITKKAYLFFLPPLLWFLFKDRKKTLIILLLALLTLALSDWIGNSLKYYFERVRPCNVLEGIRVLAGCSSSFSMPSNHATNAFAFAIPFFVMFKNKLRYTFLAGALLVGISRIYVGVHYPSDVLAGALLGSALALSVLWLYNWTSNHAKERPYPTILFLFLLIISLFRIYYILNGPLDLSPDEAHYWEWSRRLDWSYYSKGPMMAYLIYIGTSLFGDSVFGIRVMAVICSALSSIFLYILGKNLYNENIGLSSAITLQIIPLYSTYGVIFTIDSPLILLWTVSLLLFSRATNIAQGLHENQTFPGQKQNHAHPPSAHGDNEGLQAEGHKESLVLWCLLGVTVGLGLLTKYTMAFFYPCALLFLLFSKESRKFLFTKGPYLGFIISLFVFSPVIIWNAIHDWVTLHHTAGQAHIAEGFHISMKDFFEFIGSQFGVITPLLLVFMALSIWKMRKSSQGAVLFWFSIPVVIFFIFKSIQAKVQANWALPGYITGIIAFSAYYMKRFYSLGKGMQILIITALILSLGVTSVAHYPAVLKLPAKLDPTSRLHGWQELGEEVTRIYEEISATRHVFIFSDTYQVSSQLSFYVKGHPATFCINLGRRMNQYDMWPGFYKLIHYNAIFVSTGDNMFPEKLAPAFQKVEKRIFTAYTKQQIKITDYSIFLCYDFKGLEEEKPVTY
jgi:4-amino-4-deoxy-L-arabinose transferase-like glycosyltransferase/membrane-associated phospholipid phosphatase